MTNITQDEHGTITISLPDAGLDAHMSPEVFDVLARQEERGACLHEQLPRLSPEQIAEMTSGDQRVYGDLEPVTMTAGQMSYMLARADLLPRFTADATHGIFYPTDPTKVTTRNQRKRWRKRMNRG